MDMQWAFGVVCWEVFNFGRNPYPGIDNSEILDYIGAKYRLKRPSLCPQNMYVMMYPSGVLANLCNVNSLWFMAAR